MKRLALCLLAMTLPVAAFAQDGVDPEVNMNLHVTPADFALFCAAFDDGGDCGSLSHAPVAGPAFIWVVASNFNGWVGDGGIGNGLTALQFGIEYTGLNVDAWFLCAGASGSEVPQNNTDGVWPASGTGNAVAWGLCYDPLGENAKAGLFLLNAGATTGSMTVTADPRVGAELAAYVDCDAFTWEILGAGLHNLDLDAGSSPECAPIVPTVEKSWGQIKSLF